MYKKTIGKVEAEGKILIKENTDLLEESYRIADLFKVFGNNTRIRILHYLFLEESSVGDLAMALEMSHSAISHQLRVIKESRLIKSRREGKFIIYFLADNHVRAIISQGIEHIEE
ncbi:metalloregulator ArsR/SmtB family transcription factor [Clostridium estertheticum]|nr:metalloregulator ArsR/SmtB family transcription factor [Clostridium estertheticum]